MASSSSPPSLYTKPSEDLWTEWLDSLINWKTFGIYLPEIKQKDVEKIEEDKTGVDNRKMALWSKWSTVYPNGTWDDVIKALKKMKENMLAVEIEGKLSKEQVHKGPPIPPPPSVDINKLRRIITEVIRTNYADLSKTLKSNISAIAKEMYARGLLSESVKDCPTYDSLMREFEAGLNFKKTVKAIEEHCQSFIASVSSQKGPAESHARAIADEWKDGVMKELKFTFNV